MGEGSGVAMSWGVGRRRGSDPAWLWLWLWLWLAAVAPIRALARELPYATGVALISKKKNSRSNTNPALLWLWRRPVATAPSQPLAWEPPYAAGAAQEIATNT